MKDYIKKDAWKIIEEGFVPEYNQISESLMSLGNGSMGQRANFEESYTGETLQGSYLAGVYYPDKTRVGWWKNGYPEYFAKVLNSCNWIGIKVMLGEEEVDLAKAKTVKEFYRELDMQCGLLTRKMHIITANDAEIEIVSRRFISMHQQELGAISYDVKSINYNGYISIVPYLDFNVVNQDSNYDETFWKVEKGLSNESECYVSATTKKTEYDAGVAMSNVLYLNDRLFEMPAEYNASEGYCEAGYHFEISPNEHVTLEKFAILTTSMNVEASAIKNHATKAVKIASKNRFDAHLEDHLEAWKQIWDMCDIEILGDVSAQQGIRFNIFHLYQTYTGHDSRLNIGPKGFTGEKYGGSTYWDTEAYCLPFYLSTADQSVARNLLVYRYNHLDKAIENAEKLGFTCGAALYPMVTMTGEECHNEWEITFEEIHRNGAIAYAIYDYINYTNDTSYLAEYGVEVLVGIARFWSQRVNWSNKKEKYVMLGVTGPNEYENNVNNNWYTNYIASWCLKYAQESLEFVRKTDKKRYAEIVEKIQFHDGETKRWQEVIDKMYYPEDEELGIYLQQDNFLDKEQTLVADLDDKHRPLNQNWSWDRILRSCFIKQADVLQGMYFFENDFDEETHRRNFLYYEPRTVHESSLSPCVHSILATKLGMEEKAYEMYLRTSRLDLDDYNNDTEDGCHITSMAGTWLSIVKGFGGQRVADDMLSFRPLLPSQWQALKFKLRFRENLLQVNMTTDETTFENLSGPDITILVDNKPVLISSMA